MNNLNGFLHLYFYQLEDMLNKHNSELDKVKFQSEEANTDEYLKLFFKTFILANKSLHSDYHYDVKIKNTKTEEFYKIDDLLKIGIEDVILPSELTEEHKNDIKAQKSAVFTKPDIYLKIISGTKTVYLSVELKSTKNNEIPGSSVQQVSPYEWVIFVQHKNGVNKSVTGVYVNSITGDLPFPDRSPRPKIGFNTLNQWNIDNRIIENGVISYTYSDNSKKEQILIDWNETLVDEWLNTVKSSTKRNNEKWFNNTIRLFSIELLEYYDSLGCCEKRDFLNTLKKLSKKN